MPTGRAEPTSDAMAMIAAFADPARPVLAAGHLAVVIAHPDDETIGCGALLGRLRGALLVHVTDGSPRDGVDARRLGFASAEAYARQRRVEMEEALRRGSVALGEHVTFDCPDKEATAHLEALVDELTALFARRRITLALTHAYEGGHPDHDACAFAVASAAARTGCAVVEMPFYRAGPRGMLVQRFSPAPGRPAAITRLTSRERATKRAMLAAFVSQADVIAWFSDRAERFRLAPSATDFMTPANGGRILYEGFGWGLTGAAWCARARWAERRMAGANGDRPWR